MIKILEVYLNSLLAKNKCRLSVGFSFSVSQILLFKKKKKTFNHFLTYSGALSTLMEN